MVKRWRLTWREWKRWKVNFSSSEQCRVGLQPGSEGISKSTGNAVLGRIRRRSSRWKWDSRLIVESGIGVVGWWL